MPESITRHQASERQRNSGKRFFRAVFMRVRCPELGRELAAEIAQLESGKRKLRVRDELGRAVPLNPIILAVFRHEAEKREKSSTA